MKVEYRPYVCSVCGHKDKISTNHEGPVLHYCKGCSWKRDFAGKENSHNIPQLGDHTYRVYTFDNSVNESKRHMNIKRLKALKEQMSEDQKRKLLVGLQRFKENNGNIGGTTDIVNPDNFVAEDEFTAATKPETNVIAKTFDTTADFDSYVNQRRGIEITPKEQQALMTERSISELAPSPMAARPATPPKPTNQPAPTPNEPSGEDEEEVTVSDEIQIATSIEFVDETQGADILADFIIALGLQSVQPQPSRFGVKFEQTDGFGLNDTTIIKKLRKGGKFCWTAFSKHESAKDEGNPEGTDNVETP